MNSNRSLPFEHEAVLPNLNVAASAELVNRTHRVIRERARTLQEQKKRARSLWIPLAVSFGMLALVLIAFWNLLEESELVPDGLPDVSQQMAMLSLWCLPVSVIVLAVVWFRRSSARTHQEGSR